MALSRQPPYEEAVASNVRNGRYLNESSILNASGSESRNGFRDLKHRNCCHRCWAWAQDGFTIISTCFATFTLAITIALTFQIRFGTLQVPPQGAVATDDGGCSAAAGLPMLRAHGSAVDAAIAALLCCSVTHPHLVGVGGGGVMLVHNHLQMISRVIDFLPDIPEGHDTASLHQRSSTGGGSIAVPGFLQGLHYAHSLYGKLPWRTLFDPAIRIARHGFTVSASLEAALAPLNPATIPSPAPFLPPSRPSTSSASGGFTNAFSATFLPFGAKLKRGTKVTRRPYAVLLENVAEFGPKAVFDTDFALEVVKLLRESGSSITVAELQEYQVQEYDALSSTFFGHSTTVVTAPHPLGGPQLLAALHLVDNTFNADATTGKEKFATELQHARITTKVDEEHLYQAVVEALGVTGSAFYRMATEPYHRPWLSKQLLNLTADLSLRDLYPNLYPADQDYTHHLDNSNNTNTTASSAAVRQLLRQEQAQELLKLSEAYGGGGGRSADQAATQVSVIDTYDLYVAAVCGLGSPFGSQLMTSHGVLFNNMLAGVPVTGASPSAASEDGSAERSKRQHEGTEAPQGQVSARASATDLNLGRTGRVRPLVPYAPFIVLDRLHVCGQRVVCSSSSVGDGVQVLTQLLQGEAVTTAVARPRVTVDTDSQALLLDDMSDSSLRLPGTVRNHLQELGYRLGIHRPPYSSVNTVVKVGDRLTSHSDTRGGGLAARLGGWGIEGDLEGDVTDRLQVKAAAVRGGEDEEVPAVIYEEKPNHDGIDISQISGGSEDVSTVKNAGKPALGSSSPHEEIIQPETISGSTRFKTGGGLRTGQVLHKMEHLNVDALTENVSSTTVATAPGPDSASGVSVVGVKKDTEELKVRTSPGVVNKKYMGDAAKIKSPDGGSTGSGVVVKGGKRGGVATSKPVALPVDINNSGYHDVLEGGVSGDRFIVNGGRGGGDSEGDGSHFSKGEATSSHLDSREDAGLPDSVFGDYRDPAPHISQVRLDDYDPAGDAGIDGGVDAEYVEAPINVWGQTHRRIVPHRHHGLDLQQHLPFRSVVVPAHVAEQIQRQLHQQQPVDYRVHG